MTNTHFTKVSVKFLHEHHSYTVRNGPQSYNQSKDSFDQFDSMLISFPRAVWQALRTSTMSAVTFSLETSSTVRQLIFLVWSVTLKELEEICDVTRSPHSRPHKVRIIQRGSAKPRAISSDDHRQILTSSLLP